MRITKLPTGPLGDDRGCVIIPVRFTKTKINAKARRDEEAKKSMTPLLLFTLRLCYLGTFALRNK
jgi:hypothetical protein